MLHARTLIVVILALAWGCRSATTARHSTMTLPWYTSEKDREPGYGKHSMGAFVSKPESRKFAGRRSFHTVVLENEYLRVEVAPQIGGAVSRAVFRPTGDDLFFFEGKAKDWLPFWESGVKVSFPYREHGVGTIQPASYRVVRRDDGSVTVAMWMEFSRFTQWYHSGFYGRYSAMLLSQHVTLSPGEGSFEVTYRIVNPAPYRQGRQIWNDALFPRNHIETRIVQGDAEPPQLTLTELVLPAAYVSNHNGRDFRRFDESQTPLAGYPPPHISIFAWDIAYGFVGLWYPRVKVNRLRLFDPRISPGVKIFLRGEGCFEPGSLSSHTYNFTEIWGGFDNLFEAVENWIGPGQTYQFTHRFALIKGIGKVDYANPDAAVNVELGGDRPRVEVVTLHPVKKLTGTFDGKPLGRPAKCAPDRPARFPLPPGAAGGRLALTADGRLILDQEFPLNISDDTSGLQRIRDCLKRSARRYELSDCGGEAWYRNAIRRYPHGSVDRGRALYRDGRLDAAIKCLRTALEAHPHDGEGWHLLGAALLEKGTPDEANSAFNKAITVKKPYPPARYFLALAALARQDTPAASIMLDRLVKVDPRHWEARLLKTWIAAADPATRPQALADARALDNEDPADPRVQFVLGHCAAATGDKAAAACARAALARLVKEPGARARLEEFIAATHGEYKPPKRLQPPE